MTSVRDSKGLAVPLGEICEGDHVITADGATVGTVRAVYDGDLLRGHILVMERDAAQETTRAYTIPAWAPHRRDAALRRLYLAAHQAHVRTRWLFATVLAPAGATAT